jgi:hypothetical protein
MYFQRKIEMSMSMMDSGTKMNITKAHELLGHCNEGMTQEATKNMGWILTGPWKECASCAVGKAKQKNVPKESEHAPATKEEEENRVFLDIATVKKPKDGLKVNKPNWRIMVDERTGMKFSDFFETKSGMIEPTCAPWNRWKDAGLAVKYVRLDNAGEKKTQREELLCRLEA